MSVAPQLLPQESGCIINSPLLSAIVDGFLEQDYIEILDTMPASSQLIDLFSACHCKLYLPACHLTLTELRLQQLDTETKLNKALTKSIGLRKQNKAGLRLILLWDLPNYLQANTLRALIQYLVPHCSANVILHTYIHTRENMPATPGLYRLQRDKRVAVEQSDTQTCPSPMYYQEALQKAMSPFIVKKGILLSSGMQEYIMQRR